MVVREGAHRIEPWPLPRAVWPAGGITCTVHDLLRHAGFHMGDGKVEDGTQLLKPESLLQMRTPQVTVRKDSKWGLSWSLDAASDGTRMAGNGGGTTGQISGLRLEPEHAFAVAVFTIASPGGFVTNKTTRWALREYLGLEMPDPEPIDAPEEELAALVGRYSRPWSILSWGCWVDG